MITRHTDEQPIWNESLRLPLVVGDSDLFDCQMLLGGISLVLSRLHPQQGKNRFTYSRGLVQKLTRLLEHDADDTLARHPGWPTSLHLAEALAECERALDTGTLIVMRRMQLQTLKDEQADAARAQNDSRFGVSVAGALEAGAQKQTG